MSDQKEMDPERPVFTIPWIKIAFGVILGIAMIYAYYLIFLQTQDLAELILGINRFTYLFAFVFGFVGVLFFAMSWKTIARAQQINLTTQDAISLTFVAYFFEGMVPAGTVPGDAVRAYLVTKRTNSPGDTVVSSIFAHRLAGMVPYSLNGLLCVVILLQNDFPIGVSLVVLVLGLLSVFAFLGLFFASLREELVKKLITSSFNFLRRIFKFWAYRLEEFEKSSLEDIENFSESMRSLLHKKKALFGSFVLATLWWLCNGISFYVVVRALHFRTEFLLLLTIYTVVSTIRSLPLPLVGGFGLIELTLATLLKPIGTPEGVALAAPVLARNVFWFLIGCSSIFLAREYSRWLIRKNSTKRDSSPEKKT